jgi:hypothetical protein
LSGQFQNTNGGCACSSNACTGAYRYSCLSPILILTWHGLVIPSPTS